MNTLVTLFLMFLKLSLFSFGGGYVMIPILLEELEKNGLATASELTEIVAIAGMSPGPVATNASVALGYKVAGFAGVLTAFLGIALPCALIVIFVASFFFKIYSHPKVQAVLYGLRPVITGIILYAAGSIALKNGIVAADPARYIHSGINWIIQGVHLVEVKSLIIAVAVFILLKKTRIHPLWLILGGGGLGILLF